MYNMDLGFQLVYSGQPDDFVNCQLVLEGASGKTYVFNIEQLSPGNNYSTIYMDSDYDGDEPITEDDFRDDFISNPMRISIKYYVKVSDDEKDGPYTVLLHESFQFEESV